MKEKDIIKTVFDFFIIDLIIFGLLAYLIAFIIVIFFGFISERLFNLYPIIAFILLIAFMYGNYKYRYQQRSEEDAIEVLELRYAKGEITKEKFEQMKKDIEGKL